MDTPILPVFWQDRTSSVIIYPLTAKPPVTREAMVFEHAGYIGAHQALKVGRYDSADNTLKLNKVISSALVPRGLILRLYENPGFQGAFVDIATDNQAVSLDWNDRASSAEVLDAPAGLAAQSTLNSGLIGESTGSIGVLGISHFPGAAGVAGVNDTVGTGNAGPGLYGKSEATGVWGESQTWMGVYGRTASTTGGAGVMGEAVGTGAGVYGKGGRVAGFFEGDVEVTGDIRLTNADCAEDFTIATGVAVEPGLVMVLGEEGALSPSQRAYDKRVAGVISGAGDYKPGIVLDKRQSSGKPATSRPAWQGFL
jgi:hypothetical protein